MTNRTSVPLVAQAKTLLAQAATKGVTYLEIYEDTGLKPNWLSRFAQGKITDPSVNRVQTLCDFLHGAIAK